MMDSEELSDRIMAMYDEFKKSHTRGIAYTDVYSLICNIVALIEKEAV